jgi:hypothetical protein
VALRRAGIFFSGRLSFLVASHSAVAERIDGAAMVDLPIPFSCHITV